MASGAGLNLKGVQFLIADGDVNFRVIVTGILRGFGATHIFEAEDAEQAQAKLKNGSIDFLLCDSHLPGVDGFEMVKSIRRDPEHAGRFVPILVLTSHTQRHNVEKARDCGANFVVAKPLSPAILYARLEWVANDERPFIVCDVYVGPERRHKIEGLPGGVGRRAEDKDLDVGDEAGPALSQDEIDSVFK